MQCPHVSYGKDTGTVFVNRRAQTVKGEFFTMVEKFHDLLEANVKGEPVVPHSAGPCCSAILFLG